MAEEAIKPKRKTKTSAAAVAKYQKRVYATLFARLPKELVYAFRERCEQNGDSQAQILRRAVEAYLSETEEAESAAEAEAETDPQ